MSAYADYLQHHGIRGQRWGRRNGPPYPLDPSDHSAREKRGERSPNSSLADDYHKSKPTIKKAEVSKSKKSSSKSEKKKAGPSKEMAELKARKPKNPHAFTKAFLRNLGNDLVSRVATTNLSAAGKEKASRLVRDASNVARGASDYAAWREAREYRKEKKAWKKEYKALKKKEEGRS